MWMPLVLWFLWSGMFKPCQHSLNIPQHENVNLMPVVIPDDGEPDIHLSCQVCHLRIVFKCITCSLPIYLTPKFSTTKQNWISLFLCIHRPGVSLLCSFPCLANLVANNSCANRPVCGKPYIPSHTATYTHPSCVAYSLSLYSSFSLSGCCPT